jgi:hypothetical protein
VRKGRADGGGKNEIVIPPESGLLHPLLQLALAVRLQSNNTASAKVYPSATSLPLWLSKLAVRESAVYSKAPAVSIEIHVHPLQAEQFAGAHPSVYGQNVKSLQTISFCGL